MSNVRDPFGSGSVAWSVRAERVAKEAVRRMSLALQSTAVFLNPTLFNPTITGQATIKDETSTTNIFGRWIEIDGDLYLLSNASYSRATGEFSRDDITRPAFCWTLYGKNNIPGETATSGSVFWVTPPGGNPIGNNVSLMTGWSLGWGVTQFRDFVMGGYGIEIDAKGAVGYYARALHNIAFPPAFAGENFSGHVTNLFVDFSGVDSDAFPSWFFGLVKSVDEFQVLRAAAGADFTDPLTLKKLLRLANNGDLYVRDVIASRGDGTGVVYLNTAKTRYLYYDGVNYVLPDDKLYLNKGITSPGEWNMDGASLVVAPDGTAGFNGTFSDGVGGSIDVSRGIVIGATDGPGGGTGSFFDQGGNEIFYINGLIQ